MESVLDGVLQDRPEEAVRLTVSLHRTPDHDFPRVAMQLAYRGRLLSLDVGTYPVELERAARELPALLDGQLDRVRIGEYDEAFSLLRFDLLPDTPDLVCVTAKAHLPSPEDDPRGRTAGFPAHGELRAMWFTVAIEPLLVSRAQLRGLADLIAAFVDPENPSPVGSSGRSYLGSYLGRARERAILPPPPGTRPSFLDPPRVREGSAPQALPFLEQALAVARTTPARPRHALLGAIAQVLAWIDPERAFTIVTAEANLTAEARADAVEGIVDHATEVPFARTQEWLEQVGLQEDVRWRAVQALAEAGSARALELAREAVDLRERASLYRRLAREAPEPLREQAREALSRVAREVAARAPEPRNRFAGWVVRMLAEVDPPAALTVIRDVPPSEKRAEVVHEAVKGLLRHAPHLLPELLDLVETNRTEWRDRELKWAVMALATADPRRALPLARAIAEGKDRLHALTRVLASLASVDPELAWEVTVETVTLAASLRPDWLGVFEREALPAVAQRLPERIEELLPLLDQGALKEQWLWRTLLFHVALRDRDRALALLQQRPAGERWWGLRLVLQGASRQDPAWVVESTLALPESSRPEMARAVVPALVEADLGQALALVKQLGDGWLAILAAAHARGRSTANPAAAAELAELALRALSSEAGDRRDVPDPRRSWEEPPDRMRATLAVVLAQADPARAMEVARALTDPELKVSTMLDIAEEVLGVA